MTNISNPREGAKDAPIAASPLHLAPSETASATSDQRVVVWDEPLCLDPVVISAVVRATEADIIALQKIGIERRNYTDQEALADWMTVHGAWFESTPSAQPAGDVERVAEELDRYANFYKKHPDAPLAEGAYEEMRAMAQALRTANEEAAERVHYAKGTAELAMKHRDEAEAEIARLRAVLEGIARQTLYDEIDDDALDGADFSGAYDMIVGVARAALATPTTGDGKESGA